MRTSHWICVINDLVNVIEDPINWKAFVSVYAIHKCSTIYGFCLPLKRATIVISSSSRTTSVYFSSRFPTNVGILLLYISVAKSISSALGRFGVSPFFECELYLLCTYCSVTFPIYTLFSELTTCLPICVLLANIVTMRLFAPN